MNCSGQTGVVDDLQSRAIILGQSSQNDFVSPPRLVSTGPDASADSWSSWDSDHCEFSLHNRTALRSHTDFSFSVSFCAASEAETSSHVQRQSSKLIAQPKKVKRPFLACHCELVPVRTWECKLDRSRRIASSFGNCIPRRLYASTFSGRARSELRSKLRPRSRLLPSAEVILIQKQRAEPLRAKNAEPGDAIGDAALQRVSLCKLKAVKSS